MATVVTAKTAPKMSSVQADATTVGAALVSSPASYAQASDQLVRDMVNDLRQLMINAGLAK